jgi:membrane fusion protein, multidrug efflux system
MTSENNLSNPVPEAGKDSSRRNRILLVVGAVFILIAIAFTAYWLLVARYVESTDNAYVQGNIVQITSQVSGTVTTINVDDTEHVPAGQPLLRLDSAEADIAVADAEAQLAQTVREVRTLYASQAQADANVALRQTELVRAQGDLTSRTSLSGSGAVSDEEIRHAANTVAAAQAGLNAARQQLVSGQALTAGTSVTQHPNVQHAAARLEQAMLTQYHSTVYAPVGGQVAKRSVQLGQRISAGTPLMAIVPLDQLWVDANFKEAQLHEIRIGQPVSLTADIYGSAVRYDGRIVGLSAGTGSAFALLPAQNATGNWIKVVQRLPVRITLDAQQLAAHPLRVGLSVQADVDLHDRQGVPVSDQKSRARAIPASTTVGNSNDAAAKARIAAIIAANLK